MRHLGVFGLLCVVGLLVAAQAVNDRPAARVDTASPVRIFNQLKETRDMRAKMDSQAKALEVERTQRNNKVRELREQRDRLNVDDPKREELNEQFRRATIELKTWLEVAQADMQGAQKDRIKVLWDKIITAIGEVAQSRGTQLVLAEQKPELPNNMESIDVNQLRSMLNERNVLYSDQTLDISNLVIAAMDAKYSVPK